MQFRRPLFSWKRVIVSVGILVVLVALTIVSYASARIYRVRQIENDFEQIHKGQTKQEVLKVLGSPDEANTWERCGSGCAERFWYYGFIEQWGIDFDANGKVIDSFYNVSP
jgi:outer membrane protein assembly factor BamE (lipoprotein component of BamABCDE complex)